MGATDEFELEDGGGGPDPGAVVGAPPRRRARAWPWAASAAVLVVAGVLVAPAGGVPLQRHTGGIAVGLLAHDVAEAPTVLWRRDLGRDELRAGPALLGDVVVAATRHGVRGFDVADGSLRWEVDGRDLVCGLDEPVVCIGDQGRQGAVMLRVDPSDGSSTTLARPGTWVATELEDGDLLLLEGDETGPTRLLRAAPDGQTRWSVPAPVEYEVAWGPLWMPLEPRDGVVDLWWPDLMVDVATGEPRLEARTVWADDRTRVVESATRSEGDPESDLGMETAVDVVHDGDVVATGLRGLMVPDDDLGGLVEIRVDHPWTPESAVVATRSGAELWRREGLGFLVARLDGVVVVNRVDDQHTDRGLEGLDVWTGEMLWQGSPVSSGAVLGAGGRTLLGVDDRGDVVGLDVRTGEIAWDAGVQRAWGSVVETPAGLVVLAGDELVHLGWED